MSSPRFDGVLFDMDGLLLDSERIYLSIFRIALVDLELEWDEALYLSMIGRNGIESAKLLINHYGPTYDHDRMRARLDHHWKLHVAKESVPLMPGVIELLDLLDELRIPCAVATSTARGRAEAKLTDAGIRHRFQGLIGGDDVSNGKPHPEPYLKAAALLGLDASRCLALEDSANGIRSAHGAGAAAVMVPDLLQPTSEIEAIAHRIAPSLLDVRDWLASTHHLPLTAMVDSR
ncbi:HAD family hydrolase [Lacibacterium aquatile]|uniref:HAD family hydrolase n=1 Tax=Lacibacterium aquatile TaxID=1168082 RepID=A0ABW5DQK4_9PROT